MKYNTILKKTALGMLFVSSIVLGSCTDLDETLYSELPGDGSYKFTETEIAAQYGVIYDRLRDMYDGWEGYMDISQECGDLIMTPYRTYGGWGAQYVSLHKHEFHPTINHLYRPWYSCYQGINSCNQLLDDEVISSNDVAVAELRTFRALFYYVLFDLYRNIPVTTTLKVPSDYMPEQETPQFTYDFIVKELEESKPLLTKVVEKGQLNYYGACMLLAKMYLNHDAWLPESPNNQYYGLAIEQVNEVINSGVYTLAENYREPFSVAGSKENIFELMYNNKYAGHGTNHFCKWFPAVCKDVFGVSFDPWNGSACIPQFFYSYDDDDSRKADTWKWGVQRDQQGNILYADGKEVNLTPEVWAIEKPGAGDYQGARLWLYEIQPGNIGTSDDNVPFFRLTDAYLIKAECLLRLGGYKGETEQDAADIVTMIRRRAFKKNPEKAVRTVAQLKGGSVYDYGLRETQGTLDADKNITNVEIIETHEGGDDIILGGLLDELAWEFVYEHHRRQDLIRFKMTNGCNVFNGKSWFGKSANTDPNDRHKDIFPILQDNLDANPKLKQNPGYNKSK
ncbi:RagB/SusD family nutrient uptake outer membrane protein [Phocaeicola paurosaccharolyticus]|jgi:starch-binding outer membrane protein, SusD/RagB family|uniref:RagB/SusD family nutrient uptake outer membrane protein n=1 Tax=Phocaeicola paurosaccharolyticus TaxID=732242 RepID=UPI000469F884|nr:RagB/SusD family nutrient uptake outer membrane protein [Phocaeicola paurosaccharolyticus]